MTAAPSFQLIQLGLGTTKSSFGGTRNIALGTVATSAQRATARHSGDAGWVPARCWSLGTRPGPGGCGREE
jgi:hypothetical protein